MQATAQTIEKAADHGLKPFILGQLTSLGDAMQFTWQIILGMFTFFIKPPFEINEFLKQCYMLGNKTLGLVLVTGFIMGMVLTLQSRPVLAEFGAESWLPSMVSLSFLREIGPVITALICAGRIGSGIGAEVSSMKVTEQIEAMEVSATNPFRYIVVTRVLACALMVPLLVVFSDVAGLVGSFASVNIYDSMSFPLFFVKSFASVDFMDLFPSIIKSVFFGLAIGIVGCYQGYNAGKGTESVGAAANSAFVISSLVVFFIDLVAVQIVTLIHLFN
ncbi:MAG: MlaE family ABC transporter permease [Cytophagales bacterium]